MKLIYKIPIIGNIAYYIWYLVGMVLIPLVSRLAGYQKVWFGSSIVWTPKNRREVITEGFDLLLTIDKKMYSCITGEGRFVFFYTAGKHTNFGGRYYGLEEQVVRWGREAVAALLVQSILMFQASPGINKANLGQSELAALRVIPQRVLEWMRDHSFPANFIEAYSVYARRWENQKVFT